MSDLQKRKKEFLKAYNNLCSCYGELVSEQTKITCNILAEKVKLEQQLSMAVEALNEYGNCENWNNIYDSESADFEPLYWANKWKDEYGYKYAQEKLKQIKELEK